jgi:hypothetical protein
MMRVTAVTRSSGKQGFGTSSVNPAAIAAARSHVSTDAVNATTGTCASVGSFLNSASTWAPFIPFIRSSSRMMSGTDIRAKSIDAVLSEQAMTRKPRTWRYSAYISRVSA